MLSKAVTAVISLTQKILFDACCGPHTVRVLGIVVFRYSSRDQGSEAPVELKVYRIGLFLLVPLLPHAVSPRPGSYSRYIWSCRWKEVKAWEVPEQRGVTKDRGCGAEVKGPTWWIPSPHSVQVDSSAEMDLPPESCSPRGSSSLRHPREASPPAACSRLENLMGALISGGLLYKAGEVSGAVRRTCIWNARSRESWGEWRWVQQLQKAVGDADGWGKASLQWSCGCLCSLPGNVDRNRTPESIYRGVWMTRAGQLGFPRKLLHFAMCLFKRRPLCPLKCITLTGHASCSFKSKPFGQIGIASPASATVHLRVT